jgi:hypothetical protein
MILKLQKLYRKVVVVPPLRYHVFFLRDMRTNGPLLSILSSCIVIALMWGVALELVDGIQTGEHQQCPLGPPTEEVPKKPTDIHWDRDAVPRSRPMLQRLDFRMGIT